MALGDSVRQAIRLFLSTKAVDRRPIIVRMGNEVKNVTAEYSDEPVG